MNEYTVFKDVRLDTTLNFPCIAHTYYQIHTLHGVTQVLSHINKQPFNILSGGSNVLCASSNINIVLQVRIKGIQRINLNDNKPEVYYLQVGAGEIWHDVVLYTLQHCWNGLENLALIPGWVGAAPVQNIGAYGVELAQYLYSVHAFDIQTHTFIELLNQECQFGYRDSIFKQQPNRYLITHVTLQLPTAWKPVIHYGELATLFKEIPPNDLTANQIARAVIDIRQRKLPNPTLIPNAGSFFKNPMITITQLKEIQAHYPSIPHYPINLTHCKIAAGWLIEHAGWKGYERIVYTHNNQKGMIGVHKHQALVLTHQGGAMGQDLLTLAEDIQASIQAQFNIMLEREVNVW